jgi:hypothetical protein
MGRLDKPLDKPVEKEKMTCECGKKDVLKGHRCPRCGKQN